MPLLIDASKDGDASPVPPLIESTEVAPNEAPPPATEESELQSVPLVEEGIVNGAGNDLERPKPRAAFADEYEDVEEFESESISFLQRCVDIVMSNLGSFPLLGGTFIAVVWANVHQDSYEDLFGKHARYHLGPEGCFLGHSVTLKFVVNDFFMCLFFGLAGKEVFETLTPGGSLYPPRRAVNPFLSCLGGVVGPVAMYMVMCVIFFFIEGSETDELMTVLRGWGVPTATDIALSWVMAVRIFGDSHPAVYYLVVLAILDDAIGIMIIAIYYQDPEHPVKPLYLLLVVLGTVVALVIRKACGRKAPWFVYILLAGPITWVGLAKAHVHPALALVFVVPAMPGGHTIDEDEDEDEEDSPLETFERHTKTIVDIGLGFFTLANAGVRFGNPGTLTISIASSLIFGKALGIFGFGMLGGLIGFGLPIGISAGDLLVVGAVAGVGLTVALFVSAEAFADLELQGQAKLGALISLFAYPFALLLNRLREVSSAENEVMPCDQANLTEEQPNLVSAKSFCSEASMDSLKSDLEWATSRDSLNQRQSDIHSPLRLSDADWPSNGGTNDFLRLTGGSKERAESKELARSGSKRRRAPSKRGRRPSGKAAKMLVFTQDVQAQKVRDRLTKTGGETERGKRIANMARQMLGGVLLGHMGGNDSGLGYLFVAFYGWRTVLQENRLLIAQRLLAFSSGQSDMLVQVAFSYWREVVKQNAPKERRFSVPNAAHDSV